MKTSRLRTLAASALLAVGGLTTAQTATATDGLPSTAQIPAGWTILVDDTQTTAIAVPSAWNQVQTVPDLHGDRTPRPWISATTDEGRFFPAAGAADTFSVPGVVYIADRYNEDTESMLLSTGYDGLCTAEQAQPYDNGNFRGHVRAFNDCGGTATRVVVVAAYPWDRSFTAIVLVQLTGQPDDAATLDGMLRTFGRVVPTG
jgi:hypothetical protein